MLGLVFGFAASRPAASSDLAAGTGPGESRIEACADPCLKAAIAALYIRNPFLNPFQLGIEVKDSVATLEGSVPDAGARALAEEIATGVEGISAVVNHIQIEPGTSAQHHAWPQVDCLADDATLADRVRTQLHWNRATHGMTVTVSARDGIVNLGGTAASPQQAELARLIAINTCGVRRVHSEFRTKPEP
jgi:osmotically-inducible protein OsmY